DAVRSRGAGKWSARCPAHADKSPSLSITEGQDGRILLHCFAGCTPQEIVSTLGVALRDLFTDTPPSSGQRPKPARVDRVDLAFHFEVAALDHRHRADTILDSSKGIDVSALTETELDQALACVDRAYGDIERAELLEQFADSLREKERTARERPRAA